MQKPYEGAPPGNMTQGRDAINKDGMGDLQSPLFETDDFRIWCMKVLPCTKRFVHDWTVCPFAHEGEKAVRRDPREEKYTGIACPDMKKSGSCIRGDQCPYAHNVFEYWLHPTRYRTQLCNDGPGCKRNICFFAHDLSQLRVPESKPYVSPEALAKASLDAIQNEKKNASAAKQQQQQSGGSGDTRSSSPFSVSHDAQQGRTTPDTGSTKDLQSVLLEQQQAAAMQALTEQHAFGKNQAVVPPCDHGRISFDSAYSPSARERMWATRISSRESTPVRLSMESAFGHEPVPVRSSAPVGGWEGNKSHTQHHHTRCTSRDDSSVPYSTNTSLLASDDGLAEALANLKMSLSNNSSTNASGHENVIQTLHYILQSALDSKVEAAGRQNPEQNSAWVAASAKESTVLGKSYSNGSDDIKSCSVTSTLEGDGGAHDAPQHDYTPVMSSHTTGESLDQ